MNRVSFPQSFKDSAKPVKQQQQNQGCPIIAKLKEEQQQQQQPQM